MAELLGGLAEGEGFCPSLLQGVRFMRSTLHVPRTPVAYDPSIVIVAQGRKLGYLGGRRLVFDPANYLVLSVPLPFECETLGTPREPLLGVAVSVNPSSVAELALQMEGAPGPYDKEPPAIGTTPLDEGMAGAAMRLLESLRAAESARILGPQIVKEILYLTLRGAQGASLRALAAPQTHFGQIGRVLNLIHTAFDRPLDINSLAREAGMSPSTFHTHFKRVTSSPPLRYIKTTRLHKARMLMAHDGQSAGSAAQQVGYESPSQFSREFKRLFGASPSDEASRLRKALIRLA